MAYRRRQGITRAATFKEEIHVRPPLHEDDEDESIGSQGHSRSCSFSPSAAASAIEPLSSSPSSSLAAQAIRASAAQRASCLSEPSNDPPSTGAHDMRNAKEEEGFSTFWGVLAQKAKSLLDDEPIQEPEKKMFNVPNNDQYYPAHQPQMNYGKVDNPALRKSLDALRNQIGGRIENAYEEGRTTGEENKTADLVQETRKLQIMRNAPNPDDQNYSSGVQSPWKSLNKSPQHHMLNSHEDRLKAARDVAMAMAAKAKVLLRELKTVKADFAFAKERCSQLEDENKLLREACEKGDNPEDDDMIRLQLETLLAEKARLAHDNAVYARENRFLREIVEYHQLTLQDVVYLDEDVEEITEAYSRRLSSVSSPPSPSSLVSSHDEISLSRSSSHNMENRSSFNLSQNDSKDYQQNKPPITPPSTGSSNRL